MNAVLVMLAKFAIGKHVLAALAKVHNVLDGRKSEVSAALLAVVHLLKMAEVIPAAQADVIEQALMAVLPLALADRASKIMKQADAVASVPKDAKPG